MSGFGVQGFEELMRARVLGGGQAQSRGVGLTGEGFEEAANPLVGGVGEADRVGDSAATDGESGFDNVLGDALQKVADLGSEAKEKAAALSRGEPVELHDLYVAMNKSDVAFSLMLEVRNKLVEAWQMLQRSVM